MIPFVVVALATTSIAALVALSLLRRALESRVVEQVIDTSRVLSRSDFALNAAILRTTKEITATDIVAYNASGEVIASTFSDGDEEGARLAAAIMASEATRTALAAVADVPVLRQVACPEAPCQVAYRRLETRPQTIVAVIARTAEVSAASTAIARTILLTALAGLALMAVVSQIVARRVTRPIEHLVAFTRDVLPGASRRRAPVGEDEIGRLGAAFNEMLDRLERAQDALVQSEKLGIAGLLAARVAHDIRNPLSSIKMQAQLLRSQLTAERRQALLQSVLQDVDQVESVVRGLLEVARPGTLALEPASPNELLGDLLRQLTPQLSHSHISVVQRFADRTPEVAIDVNRFTQAIRNVIVNAIEAMPQGGTLEVATSTKGSSLIVEICDDGIGVDEAMLGRLFDPFVSTKREGVGLGLVNTKAVVESHGGRISVARRQPRGTSVTIEIPSNQARSAPPSEASHG